MAGAGRAAEACGGNRGSWSVGGFERSPIALERAAKRPQGFLGMTAAWPCPDQAAAAREEEGSAIRFVAALAFREEALECGPAGAGRVPAEHDLRIVHAGASFRHSVAD